MRWWFALLGAIWFGGLAQAAPLKVLRYAFPYAETQFDPAQITDLYSRTIAAGIFDAPLEYAFHAKTPQLRPNTLAAMPEVSADQRTFTFQLKPGIFFADDPIFIPTSGGRPRELVAADYVYSIKRHYDPRWKSGHLALFESAGILGLPAVRQEAQRSGKGFDYDRPVEGIEALDRYRFRIRLARPAPRFLYHFADASVTGAVAREVVEAHGDAIGTHPVGTGPFRLAQWRRASLIALERNPGYRERFYDEPGGDPALQGRRLPMVDRVEVSIIEQPQPRWLAFLNGEHELIENVPGEYVALAAPNGKLAPNLAAQGIQLWRYARPGVSITYFAMENPLVGGYAPAQVALRRAMSLSVDLDREVRLVRQGQAVPAQGPIAPGVYGHNSQTRTEMSQYDTARARALLDMYGWTDRDGDGWREQPNGQPLTLVLSTQSDSLSRQLAEQWQRSLQAIGLRLRVDVAGWPENLKRSRAGQLMMWGFGWLASDPDADTFLALGYGPDAGQSNPSRFKLAAFDALYERQAGLPDGPERLEAIDRAQRLLVAYMPMKAHIHHLSTDLVLPAVRGYHRNPFVQNFWLYVDVEKGSGG